MRQPLLSIIIPTKGRYKTLLPLLEYLRTIKSDDIEILIQDNSNDNLLVLEYLKNCDHEITYFHTSKDISQTENADLAVLNSKGEYVCFIGDDDGVMPYILDVVRWMKKQDVDVVKGYKPNYSWPGQKSSYLDQETSGIFKHGEFDYEIKLIDVKKALKGNLSSGGTNITDLPCLYHGIASRKKLNEIFQKTKSYFPGPSPDMSNAISLCLYADSCKYLNFPIVISGKSLSSIGGKGVLHQHLSKIEDVHHLPSDTSAKWDKKIPKYWTGPTIWAQSAIHALKANGEEDKIKFFNYSFLYARLMVFSFGSRKQIFENFEYNIYSLSFLRDVVIQFYSRSVLFLSKRIGLKKMKMYKNVQDIGCAVNIMNNGVDYKKLPF